MTRIDAIARVNAQFTSGDFLATLDRMVGYKTESQSDKRADDLRAYLEQELTPTFTALGFTTDIIPSPSGRGPHLLATYHESDDLPTVLMYGHGDVVPGMEGEWRDGLDPWRCTSVGERVYGRGTADNKGQHAINIAALRAVHEARGGKLGFNAKFIIEMGEEIGSPDLPKVCEAHRDALKADLFLASDGPRLSAERPTIFLGCRGGRRIHLDIELRDGAHHSGNWGGLLANPATILASAIATLVDSNGRILLDALKPPRISNQVRAALADVIVAPSADEPALSENWGEDGLSPAERLYAWNTLEVLAINAGNINNPANAIPGKAGAVLQLRFVVGTDIENVVPANREASCRKRFCRHQGEPVAIFFGLAHRYRQSLGWLGRRVRSQDARVARRRCCRISAARCRMTCSRIFSACPPCGCRIPIPAARSTRRMNTFSCR